jgi:hypothetical protein
MLQPEYIALNREFDWQELTAKVRNSDVAYRYGSEMSVVGRPLYLAESLASYRQFAVELNARLQERFGELLGAFADSLGERLNKPIFFDRKLACPGFHVFHPGSKRSYPGGVWHIDVFNFEILPRPESAYSATLLLGDDQNEYALEFECEGQVRSHPHRIGRVTLLPSEMRHRIAPFSTVAEASVRVTLQGHVWIYQEHGVLFW